MSQTFFEMTEDGKNTFYCPACDCRHWFDNRWAVSDPTWCPTVRPSINVAWTAHKKDVPIAGGSDQRRCHLFITHGNIEYLKDCTHDLAGKTVPLQDITNH